MCSENLNLFFFSSAVVETIWLCLAGGYVSQEDLAVWGRIGQNAVIQATHINIGNTFIPYHVNG